MKTVSSVLRRAVAAPDRRRVRVTVYSDLSQVTALQTIQCLYRYGTTHP